jgi:hypothetical protein
MSKERIYIAGAYRPKNVNIHAAIQLTQKNVDKAICIANKLIRKGHYIFIPHLSHYVHTHYSCNEDYGYWWFEEDNTFLEHWATAIFMLPGWENSGGAKLEYEKAKKLGLKIFHQLIEVSYDK